MEGNGLIFGVYEDLWRNFKGIFGEFVWNFGEMGSLLEEEED